MVRSLGIEQASVVVKIRYTTPSCKPRWWSKLLARWSCIRPQNTLSNIPQIKILEGKGGFDAAAALVTDNGGHADFRIVADSDQDVPLTEENLALALADDWLNPKNWDESVWRWRLSWA